MIENIRLMNDTSQSFALYLPKNYSDTSRFPIIIFFDPHGVGSLPVSMYKTLAEQYHYILIGSNSSKNGLQMDAINHIANQLIEETKSRFSVDLKNFTLCGHSGGAKIALMIGAANRNITSVIYSGAVLLFQPDHPVSILGNWRKLPLNITWLNGVANMSSLPHPYSGMPLFF